jgi:hypothetical protein
MKKMMFFDKGFIAWELYKVSVKNQEMVVYTKKRPSEQAQGA